jgi:hypothetical protein
MALDPRRSKSKAVLDTFRGTVWHVTGISSHSIETDEVVTILR